MRVGVAGEPTQVFRAKVDHLITGDAFGPAPPVHPLNPQAMCSALGREDRVIAGGLSWPAWTTRVRAFPVGFGPLRRPGLKNPRGLAGRRHFTPLTSSTDLSGLPQNYPEQVVSGFLHQSSW